MKTGSTALALGLSNLSRQKLLPPNIIYPTDGDWPFTTGTNRIVKHKDIKSIFLFEQTDYEFEAIRVMKSINYLSEVDVANLESTDVTLILLDEGIFSLFARNSKYLDKISTLENIFSRVVIVFGVRDQRYALKSLHSQLNRQPNTFNYTSFEDFLKNKFIKSPLKYDYSHMNDLFENKGRIGNIKFLNYEESDKGTSKYLQRFLLEVGQGPIELLHSSLDADQYINPSLPDFYLKMITNCRELTQKTKSNSITNKLSQSVFQALNSYATKKFMKPSHRDKLDFSTKYKHLFLEISEKYTETNHKFLSNYPSFNNSWMNKK